MRAGSLFVAAWLGVIALEPSARAEPEQVAKRGIYQLDVNGTTVDDVIVLMVPGDVLIPLDALRRGGVVRLKSAPVQVGATAYVSLAASEPKLKYSINENDLTLDVNAPPDALAETTVDVSDHAPQGAWYTEETSAYLTYAPSLIDLTQFRAFVEAGLNSGALRVSTNASYDAQNGAVRLMSQWVQSDRQNVRELVIGDCYASTGALGGSALLGGVTFQRNFALDPYLVRVPRLGYQGSVMAPSTVDVYVNNVLVRRVAVEPGQFDLQGIAPLSGAGNVRYVINDPLGRTSDVAFDYYAAATVLRPGLSEYAYSVGFVRERYGMASFDYGEPMLLAHYRIGLTNALTAGARFELAKSRGSGGSEITIAGRVGELDLASAASSDSRSDPRRGSAGQIGYYYQAGKVSLRAVVKYTSRYYSTVNLAPTDDRQLVEYSTASGVALGPRVSVSGQVGFGNSRDTGPHAQMSLIGNAQISRSVSLQLVGTRSDNQVGQTQYEAFATLNFALAGNHTASLNAHATSISSDATASVTKPIIGTTGFGYQASATYGPTRRYVAALQAQTSFIHADASYFNENGRSHSVIDGSGTLVYMEGAGVFASRPIDQSFAVAVVPGVADASAYLNNQEIARTNAAGVAFLPNLLPYYGNRVRVDDPDLPNDLEIEDGEVIVAPPPHGGAKIVFQSRRLRLVRGKLDPRGLPLEAVQYGTLTVMVDGKAWASPIGVGGEFELDGLPEGTWPGRVEGESGSCVLTLRVARSQRAITDLGHTPCIADSGSR